MPKFSSHPLQWLLREKQALRELEEFAGAQTLGVLVLPEGPSKPHSLNVISPLWPLLIELSVVEGTEGFGADVIKKKKEGRQPKGRED